MTTEIVWTPIKDDGKDINKSPIWDDCYKDEEMTPKIRKLHNHWYTYTIKFDGLTPIQVTKFKHYKT